MVGDVAWRWLMISLLVGTGCGRLGFDAGMLPPVSPAPDAQPAGDAQPPPPTGLLPVAAYSFDEGTGTTASDASGHGHTGTLFAGETWVSGHSGGALSFDGTGYVTIPHTTLLDLGNAMTLEAWVNPATASTSWRDVIYKPDDQYYLSASAALSGPPAAGVSTINGRAEPHDSTLLTTNTWSHLAATYDGATLRLYLNGQEVASDTTTGAISPSSNPLQIGGDSFYGQHFVGLIDDVRVYDIALTTQQIQADMAHPVGGP
jgi:hypothetical protein